MHFRLRCILVAMLAAGSAAADENVIVVFDGSNSMWGQIDGTAKIEIARGVMDNLLGDWTEDRSVGLMAYGHRRRGDCTDIEVLVPPGTQARQSILDRINAITPTGKTPLTAAVEQAARELSYTDRPATVVLISDGLESCDRDPCALAEALEKGGVGFTAHVVGFGLGADEDAASLACIADRTGGQYISASNAQELGTALSAVATAVAEPEPEPEPAPEPEAPQVTVEGPETAVGGSDIRVTWAPTVAEADYITVVPAASQSGEFGSYVRIGKAEEVTLPVPGDPGLYEIRYVSNATKDTLGAAPIEVIEPEVTLDAADSVQTGGEFKVTWSPTINKRDYITIVPIGTDEGEFGNYVAVRSATEVTLRAPADPGLYEIRYVLNIDKRTVASRPVEVVDPEVVLQVPDIALTGAAFDVSWAGTVNARDYITIVPVGTDEGEFGNYIVVRDDARGSLKAPAETGMYEVRYVLREGNKTLATEMIEVTAPEVTVAGPDAAVRGSKIEVSWTGTVAGDDYVTIVPVGTPEGEYGNYVVVRNKDSAALNVPAETGMYELRYILREGAKTLATAMIEVTEPEVTVSAPEAALAGSVIEVSWTGTVNTNDYVTIVPVGTEEGQYGNYVSVRTATSKNLQAPADPGMYEVRYVLREGNQTLASVMIEITEPEVTVSAPDAVRAGDTLPVSWTGTVSRSDYVTIVPMGTPDDKYGAYFQVRRQSERDMTAPEETGMYEVRYVLREGNRVLARQMVEVLSADAPLETGASLTAPETAAPGATIAVSWTADTTSADQRITLARAEQAIFTWISATKITGAPPVDITLPDEPGVYEIRLLDVSNQAVLSRKLVKVE
ncbi:MAG: VWA domain-containing protein [Rhodobacter sp.]|nr:VWA domain-containing protein [Rhodobacter sp.]